MNPPSELTQEYKPGSFVILDDEYKVEVIKQTPIRLYTIVSDGFNKWRVMTYRLKPLKTNKP